MRVRYPSREIAQHSGRHISWRVTYSRARHLSCGERTLLTSMETLGCPRFILGNALVTAASRPQINGYVAELAALTVVGVDLA